MDLDDIPCRARLLRDDRNIPPRQGIDERTLPHIRQAYHGHVQALAQNLAASAVIEVGNDLGMNIADLLAAHGRGALWNLLIGEIDSCLDPGRSPDKP